MPTITTAVRALQLGDVLVDPLPTPVGGATSYVVLDLAIADPGPVGVQLARLGPIPPHLDRVATVSWPADTVLEVVRPKQPASAAGVPVDVSRSLLRQAELFEQLFGLHDVLDVAYVADSLRAAAGVAPIHDGPTSERAAALEFRRQVALGLLQDVERLAAGGHAAHVCMVHDEIQVSSVEVHNSIRDSVARALEETRVRAWHAMTEERDNLGRLLRELYSAGSDPSRDLYDRVLAVLERLPHPARPGQGAYSVQPNRCSCHPETCACKPWLLKQGAATVTSLHDRDAAVEMARRLNG